MNQVALRSAVVLCLAASSPAHAAAPLTLEQAIAIARKCHPSIELSKAQVAIARARRQQALANLLPFITARAGYEPQTGNIALTPAIERELGLTIGGNVTVNDVMGQPVSVFCHNPGQANCVSVPFPPNTWALSNYSELSVGVNWTLWDWGRSIYSTKSAGSGVASAEVGVVTVERNVVLAVKLAFFGEVGAEEEVRVGEQSVATFQKYLDQTRAFYETGIRTRIDVATAESALAGADITLARARAALASARAALSVALGEDNWQDWQPRAAPGTFDVNVDDERRWKEPEKNLFSRALTERTEPRQLELQSRSYQQLAKAYRGQYLPALSLNVGPTWAGVSSLTPNFTVALVLAYPLNGMSPLLVHGQVREAEGDVRATDAQERATIDSIHQETVTARALLESGTKEVIAARAMVTAAADQRALAEGRYRSGLGNIIELWQAQLNFVSAEFQQIQAGVDLADARAQLRHALGEEG